MSQRLLPSLVAGCLLSAAPAIGAPDPHDAPVHGERIAYHASKIYSVPGQPPVEDGWLIVTDGRVEKVVADRAELPPLIEVRDLGSAVIAPGLVAADSLLGQSWDGDLSLGAHRRAIDAFDPYLDLSTVLSRGVTTFYVSPDRNRLVGGQGAVVKSAGANRVLAENSDLRVSLESSAWNPPGYFRPPIPPSSDNPIKPPTPQAPTSRAGAMMALRESAVLSKANEGGYDAHRRAFGHFLQDDRRLRVAAHSEGELLGALQLAREWGKGLVVDGAAEAGRMAKDLASAKAGVIFDVPLFLSMSDGASWERMPDPDSLQRLEQAEVSLALGVRFGRWTWLLEAAAAAVGYGLSEEQALAAITSEPARLLNVDDRVGSLAPGLDADFLVLTASPLDPAASVAEVFIEGKRVWRDKDARKELSDAVVLRAGTVWTGHGAPLTGGGEVLLENGKVIAVGPSVGHPPGARVIDAGPDAHLTPGFIDARGHLGLGNRERPSSETTLGLLAAGSAFSAQWLNVARAGITTMVVAPERSATEGSRTQAVKTAARTPDEAYIAEHELVHFSVVGGDRAAREASLRATLDRGKKYADQWKKYRESRAKWEQENSGKQSKAIEDAEAALRERLAKGLEPVKEQEEDDEEDKTEEVETTEQKVDPINGTWEALIEDERIGMPITLVIRMSHEGSVLTGVASSPDDPSGQSMELQGTFNEDDLSFVFELETQFGTITITGEIDEPDHMIVQAQSPFGVIEFEARRTEVGAATTVVNKQRRRSKKKEGPQPPNRQWRYEGIRALLEGRATALVEANRADEIELAIRVFRSYEIDLQIVGGRDAHQVADLLREKKVGVVVSPDIIERRDQKDSVPAAELAAHGIATAFQSAARGGARFLPQSLAMATRYGLGANQALAGLTSQAAKLLGLEDRVGRLAAGLDGDAVILSGPPFDLRTRVLHVFVNGREVPQR